MRFLLAIAGLTMAGAANAATVPAGPSMRELLDIATTVCPLNPTPTMMHNAAKDAHLLPRDERALLAMCSIYHKGRADEARIALIRDYGIDPARR